MTLERLASPGTASAAEFAGPSLPGSPYVDLWVFTFDELGDRFGELHALISSAERLRAERYRTEEDRRRFVLGRGQLRGLIEGYTGRAAATVSFAYGPHGRPHLNRRWDDPDLRFSVSHSTTLIAYAFALEGNVGVDLEPPVGPDDLLGRPSVYRRLLTPRELRTVEDLPADQRAAATLRSWVRKEACLKSLGSGLSMEPSTLDVWGEPPSGRGGGTHVAAPDGARLWVEHFTAGDHVGAIALCSPHPARVVHRHGLTRATACIERPALGGIPPLAASRPSQP